MDTDPVNLVNRIKNISARNLLRFLLVYYQQSAETSSTLIIKKDDFKKGLDLTKVDFTRIKKYAAEIAGLKVEIKGELTFSPVQSISKVIGTRGNVYVEYHPYLSEHKELCGRIIELL